MATELWNYPNGQALYSTFCSSIYEDSPLNYLVDYAYLGGNPSTLAEILALDASGNKIFDYRYNNTGCNQAWNSIPVHWEQIVFTTIIPPTAVSRKVHGSAGTFDIPLPLTGSAGVECRSGVSGTYQVVVTFATPVALTDATVTPGSGGTASVAGAPVVSGNQVTVNLTDVSNAQTLAVNLIGVNDGSTTENISVPMGVLIGDSNGNHSVNSRHNIRHVKSRSGQPATILNFRQDITANGSINSSDVSLVKSKSGSGIP